jgi:hypothetical protein
MTLEEYAKREGIELVLARDVPPTFLERVQHVMPDNIVHLMMFGFTVWAFCKVVMWLSRPSQSREDR